MKGKFVHQNLVWYDGQRWFDAIGPNVTKFLEDFVGSRIDLAAAGATGIQAPWTLTVVEGAGNTTAVQIADGLGGILQISTGTNENDGLNAQVTGEAFNLTNAYPLYFGCRFKLNTDATQCDILVGMCETDTDLLGGMNEGIYFRKVDGSTTMNFVLEEGATETVTAYGTAFAPDVWHTVEFYFDGANVDWWVNGVRQTRPVVTNLPNGAASFLTPSIHFLTGEGNANVCEIDWIRAIQIQV